MLETPLNTIFVARITGSGAAVEGYIPHSWIEQTANPGNRSYLDAPFGRSGTTTTYPAYDINQGVTYQTNKLVFMAFRIRSGTSDDKIYDILGPANPSVLSASSGANTKITSNAIPWSVPTQLSLDLPGYIFDTDGYGVSTAGFTIPGSFTTGEKFAVGIDCSLHRVFGGAGLAPNQDVNWSVAIWRNYPTQLLAIGYQYIVANTSPGYISVTTNVSIYTGDVINFVVTQTDAALSTYYVMSPYNTLWIHRLK